MDSPTDAYFIDYQKPLFPQFLRTVNIEPDSEAAKEWKSRLTRQATKHLDIKKTTTQQAKQMRKIEEELKTSYPDTFNEENKNMKMRCAMRTITRIHTKRRTNMSLKERNMTAMKVARYQSVTEDSSIIDLTIDDSDSEPKSGPMPLRSTRKSKRLNVGSSLETERKASAFQAILEFSYLPQTPMARILNSQTNITVSPPRVGPKVKMEEQEQNIHGNGIAFVFEFLSKCKPSMAFLLHVLLQYGCESEDHIRAVAKWNPKKREEWLVKLLNHKVLSTGRKLGEADIRCLSDRFAMYG